jgi:phosphopantothenoylcysteine synthetase/decarboxylase
MKPTPKIIKDMRRLAPETTIVQFKLETGLKRVELVERAWTSLQNNRSDWVVANDLKDMRGGGYSGVLIDREKNTTPIASRRELMERLAGIAKMAV